MSGRPSDASGRTPTPDQSTPAPASCAQRYHGEWGIRCLPNGWGEGTFAPELVQGGSTANVAPVNRFCREITLGRPFTAVTPAAGSAVCYQFVVNEAAPASFQLLLPAGISATEEAMRNIEVAPVFQQDSAPRLLREMA